MLACPFGTSGFRDLALDTNVLSELRRPRPERKVIAFIAAQPLESLYVSSVSFAEIRFGIELVSDASRRAALHEWLTNKVRPMFERRALDVTEDVMRAVYRDKVGV